jgi:hypothetical protein
VTAQFRVVVTKKDERITGPDDATVVVSVPLAVAAEPEFDAAVEFMRGRVKATGHTGELMDVLKSGVATAELRALAAG